MQELEKEKNSMMEHIQDMETLLAEKGIKVKPWRGADWVQYPPDVILDSKGNPVPSSIADTAWSQSGSLWIKEESTAISKPFIKPFRLRSMFDPRQGDHLGVSQDSEPLSSIKGTQLTILGATIDTASVEGPDIDEPPPNACEFNIPVYNKSVQAFRMTYLKQQPAPQVELPSRETAKMYSEWYFITVGRFLPVLHQPTFMKLVSHEKGGGVIVGRQILADTLQYRCIGCTMNRTSSFQQLSFVGSISCLLSCSMNTATGMRKIKSSETSST